jgi:glutamate---cysteine ligase / carboxylate-amine ligase
MDTLPTLHETMMAVALIHSLVVYLQRCYEQGEYDHLLMPHHWWMEKMNHFRSSHEGLEAHYIINDKGHSKPIKRVLLDLLSALAPTASQLGATPYLECLEKHLEKTPSYLRQKEVFQRTGSLKGVVASLAQELVQETQ